MAKFVSGEWRRLLDRSRELLARVEILDAGLQPVFTTEPFPVGHPDYGSSIHVTALSYSDDETRTVRQNASCTIVVPPAHAALIPTSAFGLLSTVSGATFRVWAGFWMPSSGQPELVPCGRYDIETCTVTGDAAGVRIELEGQDLTGRLNAADLTEPFGIIFGANKLGTAQMLVTAAIPEMQFVVTPSDQWLGWQWLDEQANRLTEVNKIMTSMGYSMWMDPFGVEMHMEPRTTTEDEASWFYDEGSVQVGQVTNSLDRSRVYNGVIVKGENTNSDIPPVRAEAWDTNPDSPTYFQPGAPPNTRIGPRPYFLTSEYIVTQDQADFAAYAELLRIWGLLQRVSLRVGINPAIEVGDVIHVDRPSLGVVGQYRVQSTSLDLVNLEWMDLVCEERRVAFA